MGRVTIGALTIRIGFWGLGFKVSGLVQGYYRGLNN